jgi:serine/threonine-protein phosphatase 2B regulatory subunit
MGAAQSAAMEGLAEEVNMSKDEIHRMYMRFRKLDKNNSGGIDANEFMQISNVANNPLAHRVISIFDGQREPHAQHDRNTHAQTRTRTRG